MDVFLTVKFKLHNPSQRRKALLLDAMKRTHLAYDKLLKAIESDVRATIGPPKLFTKIKKVQEGSEEGRKEATADLKKEIQNGMLKGRSLYPELNRIRVKLQDLAKPLPLGNGPKK